MFVPTKWAPTIVLNGVSYGAPKKGPKINGGYNYNPTSWGGFNSIDNTGRGHFGGFAVIFEEMGKGLRDFETHFELDLKKTKKRSQKKQGTRRRNKMKHKIAGGFCLWYLNSKKSIRPISRL